MNKKLLDMRVDFSAQIKPMRPLNNGFTLCKCYVLALGKNRNMSNITQEVVDGAIPTLFNIPVVGHILADDEGKYHMGGHDVALEKDADGNYRFKMLTVPYGVVPETNNVAYEEVTEPSGIKRTYLTVDIILWTGRYPELLDTIYNENVFWGQSMEIEAIEVARNPDDKDYVDVRKFIFSGLCLLGKSDDEQRNYEPCFPEAKVQPHKFTLDDSFAAKFDDMKQELALCFNSLKKGGDEKVEKENQEPQEEVQTETTSCAPEPETVPAPPEPPEQETEAQPQPQDKTPEPSEGAAFQFAATYNAKREAITQALTNLNVASEELFLRHYLLDFDDRFAYVERLLVNATHPEGQWSKGRMRYTMGENETATIEHGSFEEMLVKWLTLEEAQEVERLREEHNGLLAYKALQQVKEKKQLFASVMEEFGDLKDDEALTAITENLMTFSCADALRKELFALRGMKLSAKQEMKVPVGDTKPPKTSKQELHDEFMETYSKK